MVLLLAIFSRMPDMCEGQDFPEAVIISGLMRCGRAMGIQEKRWRICLVLSGLSLLLERVINKLKDGSKKNPAINSLLHALYQQLNCNFSYY
jgi:hypothetical protein